MEFEIEDEFCDIKNINLDRQVGCRYNITLKNAARIFVLSSTALVYLNEIENEKKRSNQVLNLLEIAVKEKLRSPEILAGLKIFGLFYICLFADYLLLCKSTKIGHDALSINLVFDEMITFLSSVESDPTIILKNEIKPFSEVRLYGKDEEFNFRERKEWKMINEKLLDESYDHLIVDKIQLIAKLMKEKIKDYMKDRIEGGKYHNDNRLANIPATNDLMESSFGVNDYLRTRTPNLSQNSSTGLVMAKKK